MALTPEQLTGIGYGSNFLGGLITNYSNYRIAENANATQERMQDKANAFSFDMWNRENAYNHPLQQMKRLQEAGINPALAYSNGISNTAGAAPNSVQPNDVHRARFDNPMLEFQNLAKTLTEAKATNELAKLRGVEQKSVEKQIQLTEKTMLSLDKDIKLKEQDISMFRTRLDNLETNTSLMRKQMSAIDSENSLRAEKIVAYQIENNFNKTIHALRIQRYGLDNEVLRLTALKIGGEIFLNRSLADKYKSETKLNEQEHSHNAETWSYVKDMFRIEHSTGQLKLNLLKNDESFRLTGGEKTTVYGYLEQGFKLVGSIFSGTLHF